MPCAASTSPSRPTTWRRREHPTKLLASLALPRGPRMTRIIGGAAGGRRIKAPAGDNTRPTSDRVREALFSSIDAGLGSISGLRFLDLYAGSGAVGLEARSRGAGVVTLVEHDKRTASLIRVNVATLGFSGVEVVNSTVAR